MTGFSARIQIAVADESDFAARFGRALQARSVFVRHDRPPEVGSGVLIEFVLPDGLPLSTLAARVTHAKPADVPGQATAGMAVTLVGLDAVAERVVKALPDAPSLGADATAVDLLSEPSHEGPVLGIDLGTTNSCVAIVEHGTPRVLPLTDGTETLPSVVFVGTERRVLTGQKAIERMVLDPGRGIYGSKRFIGRPFAGREVSTFGHFFHYQLAEGKSGLTAVKVDDQVLPLEWVSACILSQLKVAAQKALGQDVTRAVITVPAYFGEQQRHSVRKAGKIAGLVVERVLSEPTAAAVAFGYGRGLNKRILVYDLGGGTFDASLLKLSGDRMEVLATDGDAFLGGSDFDDRLTEYVLSSVQRQHGLNLHHERVTVQRIRLACEQAKKQLSEAPEARITLPFLSRGKAGQIDLDLPIARDLFETLTDDLVTRTLGIVDNVLRMANVKAAEIDDVVLVGGQSRSPFVARRLQERFGKKPSRGVHPDHAVALGAAIVAAAAYGTPGENATVDLTDILPAAISVQQGEAQPTVLLARGTKLPADKEFEIETSKGKNEYVAAFFRGEAPYEALGQVRLPATFAMAVAKSRAQLKLAVSADGMMTVTMRHPLTDQVQELRVALTAADDDLPVLDATDVQTLSA